MNSFKFRKRPVEIEAFELKPPSDLTEALPPEWFLDALGNGTVVAHSDNSVIITTLEGNLQARPGDWIIRGTAGELYPCKPDIFATIYEPVEF